ncbi:MAG: hypothetical protein IT454_04855 [Planctomycetes bacterium]|nr:hypothetical protein [Planctomycetota bacterium]
MSTPLDESEFARLERALAARPRATPSRELRLRISSSLNAESARERRAQWWSAAIAALAFLALNAAFEAAPARASVSAGELEPTRAEARLAAELDIDPRQLARRRVLAARALLTPLAPALGVQSTTPWTARGS